MSKLSAKNSGKTPGQGLTWAPGKCRGGFALVIVLIAVAILLLLYAGQLSIFTGQEPLRQKKRDKAGKEAMVWEEEFRLQDPGGVAAILPEQPAIIEAITLQGEVRRQDSRRGQITITIRPNGEVDGYWQCRYSHLKTDYSIEADFAGNIDPTKIYTDQASQEVRSKLFFITKGSYRQRSKRRSSSRASSSTGVIYVTGWIEPELSAFGRITITTDKSWHATYLWSGQ